MICTFVVQEKQREKEQPMKTEKEKTVGILNKK